MAKILLIIIAFGAGYWLLRRYRSHLDAGAPPSAEGRAEDMVRCAHCGVHVPRAGAVAADGRFFCSAAHERDAARPS